MSTRRYRTRDGLYPEAAGYALGALSDLAGAGTYPPVETGEQAREWAQKLLDSMVTKGYIESRDEVQP